MTSGPRAVLWHSLLSFALNLAVRSAGALTFIAIVHWGSVSDAGTFSLALGYLAVLTTILLGLDDILVRETVRKPEQWRAILATYGSMRVAFSVALWLILVIGLAILSLYRYPDFLFVAILSSSVLIENFGATGQSVLNAGGHFGWPLVATLAGAATRLAGAAVALLGHHGLLVLSLAWPLGAAVTAAITVLVVPRTLRGAKLAPFRFDPALARSLLRWFPAFSGASFLSGLEYQLDVVLLSIMLTTNAVGQYSAAVTIMLIVQMVPQGFRGVIYPVLVRALKDSPEAARRVVGQSLLLMTGLALAAAASMALLAPQVINLLYGANLPDAVPLLRVLSWNVIFLFLNVPLVRFMLASQGQGGLWRTLALSLSINAAANLVLIPTLGVVGAAYARLTSSALFCMLIGWQVYRRLRTAPARPG